MSYYAVTDFLADRDANSACVTLAIFQNIHDEKFIPVRSTLLVDLTKVTCFFQWNKLLHASPCICPTFWHETKLSRLPDSFESGRQLIRIIIGWRQVTNYAESCFLPLALRAARTFLPPAVLILDLKPWTFALCLFLGWNVIFIRTHLLHCT